MIEPHPLKTTLALAATLAASVAFAQMTPTPKTSPETTGTVQVAPEGQGPVTSSSDPLVQKRIEDKAARDEYKARKAEAKAGYKDEMKAAKSVRKAEKQEASTKRKEEMVRQGGPAQTPSSGGE
ncbi:MULTISPECIES: hypothetical protein [Ralstonia solanacearum species complex]|uniref:hypothetical protein n=1 Tax=Ralstonia solanacearum species complex TaxID=3116862 RepID=UPI000E567A1A|nr:hypothetical protein [Ralstonia solanacearum]BEU70770.1 hypothetical protein MAFF211271_03250 [Ralstonia pseudosolanacearum]AXV75787.1 hypothetical protein CJO76_01640 [Ralstonia solanacearum]AXV89787.1 hypothetical protein CJO79_01640 [Ralstonia solanacearum]AXW17990.1 hypothetical protein CJO85_01660 [Ralstonia solanacearum]AXW74698.1 hypothetical protein CJO97_01640 [Ralstonia solanacearum]